jgi:uncharacterized protein (TIGR03067 family)
MALALVLLSGTAFTQENSESKKFAGTWKVTKGSMDNLELPNAELKFIRLVFTQEKFSFVGTPVAKETTYTVDATKKTITIAPPAGEKATLRGLYRFDGAKLTLCITEGENAPDKLEAGPNRIYLELTKDQ